MAVPKKTKSGVVAHARRSSRQFATQSSYSGVTASIENGFVISKFRTLAARMGIGEDAVRRLARISPTTLARRRSQGRFSADESDRLHRLSRITERTIAFFDGDRAAARRWLERPAKAFGGARPLDLLINDAGVQEVDALLGRLDHGVFP